MAQEKNNEINYEKAYYLHQGNVRVIKKIKEEIILELQAFTQVKSNLLNMNNKDFNEELITKYKPFIGHIAYDTFVDRRSDYEKTKKELLNRINKLKENKEIGELITLLEEFREEKMNTTNFMKFYKIIRKFEQKGQKDVLDIINEINEN